MIYLLFLLSGISGLVYQVVWVRMFGNVFGNTIYSASIVVAVFMLGLGVGSYAVGIWADRRYASLRAGESSPDAERGLQPARPGGGSSALLESYAGFEIVIAAMGAAIALVLPHLGALSALVSSYAEESGGWYALSFPSYVARAVIAVGLLTPITFLMGGTLTLLIRHLVRSDLDAGEWSIARLYGVNTLGAALGAILTDFFLVPALGITQTQMVAVACNVAAGAGAWYLARERLQRHAVADVPAKTAREVSSRRRRASAENEPRAVQRAHAKSAALAAHAEASSSASTSEAEQPVVLVSLALAMIGFAALGVEILWFRHFNILLGGFRAVFSLLLGLILIGIGIGALAGGALYRRIGRPAETLMVVQGLFVASTLLGFALADVDVINTTPAGVAGGATGATLGAAANVAGPLAELWFNARPMLLEIAIPALLMGFSFPLANAIIQHAEQKVGRRAGMLYLANTAGAVCGSLAAGLVLLPMLGLQRSATVLMTVAAASIVPLYLASQSGNTGAAARPRVQRTLLASLGAAGAALAIWLWLPSDYITLRALGTSKAGERRLVVSDGLTELIAVSEAPGKGRLLYTNGHAMSSTMPLSQRYMRALAHVPLLVREAPKNVLVIGFGVGNTTHAATLHPTVSRVELADLSRDILNHAPYFEDANRGVLGSSKVVVYINDGRQHLQMQPPGTYDLIVLEPPPIAYAGVSALYSREFYELARTRLTAGGYVSQWLPTYQVPAGTALSMIRAFLDVFPQSVLLSGAESDLVLLGTTAQTIEMDPDRLASALASRPEVRVDLERVSLGTVHEIAGSFVGSARTLEEATRGAAPVRDDRPLQEYGVRSMLNIGHGVPGGVVDLARITDWCPRCGVNGPAAGSVANLRAYLRLLELAYDASPEEVARARRLWDSQGRVVFGSSYLGAIVPETAEVHSVLGITLAERGRVDEAAVEFSRALDLDPDRATTHWHLGAALASLGRNEEAAEHLSRSVALDPENSQAQADLGLMLAVQGRFAEAEEHLQRAVALDPQAEEARRNLALVQQRRGERR